MACTAVVIASWIVTVDPGKRDLARRVLGDLPGARLSDIPDPLVVTTECPDEAFAALHQSLTVVPGVRTVSMVVAYRDREAEDAS